MVRRLFLSSALCLFPWLLVGCAGRHGRDGLALFPKGSPTHAFFAKCPHNTHKDVPTWFCDMTESFGLFERDKPLPHEDEIKAYIAYDEGRSGVFKGKLSTTLQGALQGMELSTFGFEDTHGPGGAVTGWVVFLATQTMPDGTGIAVWCSIHAGEVNNETTVRQCHTGMKHLRDTMHSVHGK